MIRNKPLDFWKPAIRLGFPVALQNLLMSSAGMVDTLMIGMLGDVPVAAVGMASQWAWLMHIFFFGISSGGAVFIAQYWGAKDRDGILRTYGFLLMGLVSLAFAMFLFSLLFPARVIGIFSNDADAIKTGVTYLRYACFSYLALALNQVFSTVLRSTEQVKLPLYSSIASVAVNLILNYGLIFGKLGLPAMGIAGAGLATAISAWIGTTTVLLLSICKRNILISPLRKIFSFSKPFFAHYTRITLPAIVNEIFWAVGTMGYNIVFGRLGTLQFAAITIFRTVDGVFFSFYIGFCHACAVLVGREIGGGRIKEATLYADRFTVAMPLFSILIGSLAIASRSVFIPLFNISPDVKQMAMTIILLSALNLPIRNISFITICGVFRPGGDTRIGMIYDLIAVWLIALPATAISGLVLKLDFTVVFAVMLIAEDWPKTALCIHRLRSRAWIQPVVENAELPA
ncbi:MAG: MATE family efflux transporter [Clostridia bacterium]|nr:MATE family efflux transporter [Clostridia bacterium]